MRRIRIAGAAALAALLCTTFFFCGGAMAAEADDPLRPSDFAYGRTIEVTGSAALQTVLLDRAVYGGVVSNDLRDLRVFDARGEQVPHAVRASGQPPRAPRDTALHIFPLPERKKDAPPGAAWGVDAEVDEHGAVIRLRPTQGIVPPPEPARAPAPTAYLLDASRLEDPIVRLSLTLDTPDGDFVSGIRVEGSDDLSHFRPLVDRTDVLRLQHRGHEIVRTDIRLAHVKQPYLRLSWSPGSTPMPIRGVVAHTSERPIYMPRDRAVLDGTPLPDEPGAYLFDLGGPIPVDRVQVILPERNDLSNVRLLGGHEAKGPFRQGWAGLVYRFEDGDHEGATSPIQNDPIVWRRPGDRYIQLVVSPEGGGLAHGAPRLEVAWPMHQLLFVTRGPGPYELAYGRADAPETAFDATTLLRTTGTPLDKLPAASARLGPPHPLGDPSVLEPIPEKIPPRTIALWILLVAVVIAVVGMTVRLAGDMRSAPE